MLSPTQLAARYKACTTSVERTQAAGVDPSVLIRFDRQLPKTGGGETGKNAAALGDPRLTLADLEADPTENDRLEALIRPFTLKMAEIDVSPSSRMDLRHIGTDLQPQAEAKAGAEGLEMVAGGARIAQTTENLAPNPKSACVRGSSSLKDAASSLVPLNRSNPKLRTPGIAIEEQLATGKPAKVGLSGSMGGAGGTGKLKAMGSGTPNANPVNAYSGIGVNGQVNGNAALGTRNNSLSGAAKMGTVVSRNNGQIFAALELAVDELVKEAAAGATFKQNTSYDPICPHCDQVMYEKHFVPDRDEGPNMWRHRGDCYDKGAFPIIWPDQHERDAETKKMLAFLEKPTPPITTKDENGCPDPNGTTRDAYGRPCDKQASGDMLAFKAWKATGLSDEEADRKAGESLALPGDKQRGPEEEYCPHCDARQERGDDGQCNRCGKDWPEKQAGLPLSALLKGRRAFSLAKMKGVGLDRQVHVTGGGLGNKLQAKNLHQEVAATASRPVGVYSSRAGAAAVHAPKALSPEIARHEAMHGLVEYADPKALGTLGRAAATTGKSKNFAARTLHPILDEAAATMAGPRTLPRQLTSLGKLFTNPNYLPQMRANGTWLSPALFAAPAAGVAAGVGQVARPLIDKVIEYASGLFEKKAYVEPLPRWKKEPQKSLSPEFVAQPGVQNLLQSLAMAVDEHGHVVSKRAFDRSLWEEYNGPLTDEQMDGLTMGHGCVLGSCGHKLEGCRCHGGKLIREKRAELCRECQKTAGVATDENWRSYAKQAFATGLTLDELREAAAVCDPNPSEAQKKSGNYAKGHIRWKGLPITIETAKGYTRSGTDGSGKPWSITMKDHYGYIKNTESEADGDHIDVFLCEDNLDSDLVFVVNQFVDGKFDEHKCILGCENEEQARKVYLRNYADGWDGLESVCSCTIAQFKWWLKYGDTSTDIEGDFLAKNTKKADSTKEDMSLIGILKVAMDDWYAHGGNAAAYEGEQGARKLRKLWHRRDPEGLEADNPYRELFQAWGTAEKTGLDRTAVPTVPTGAALATLGKSPLKLPSWYGALNTSAKMDDLGSSVPARPLNRMMEFLHGSDARGALGDSAVSQGFNTGDNSWPRPNGATSEHTVDLLQRRLGGTQAPGLRINNRPYVGSSNKRTMIPAFGRVSDEVNIDPSKAVGLPDSGLTLNHELEHARQGVPNTWFGAEAGPSLGDLVMGTEVANKQLGKPLAHTVKFPAGKEHDAQWMLRRAKEHGYFDGKSMDELLTTGPGKTWTRQAAMGVGHPDAAQPDKPGILASLQRAMNDWGPKILNHPATPFVAQPVIGAGVSLAIHEIGKAVGLADKEEDPWPGRYGALTIGAGLGLGRAVSGWLRHRAKTAGAIDSPVLEAQQFRLGSDDPLQHALGAQHLSNFLDAGKNRATRGLVPGALRAKRPSFNTPAGPPVPPALPMPQQPALIQ